MPPVARNWNRKGCPGAAVGRFVSKIASLLKSAAEDCAHKLDPGVRKTSQQAKAKANARAANRAHGHAAPFPQGLLSLQLRVLRTGCRSLCAMQKLFYRCHKQRGLIDKRHMARLREDNQLRSRYL